MNPPKVYLDSSLLVDIFDLRDEELGELAFDASSRQSVIFPFTATHVQELVNVKDSSQATRRLQKLEDLSGGNYLYSAPNVLCWQVESPLSVWGAIGGVEESDININISRILPYDGIRAMREELGLDPQKLNNKSGLEAIREIDAAFSAQSEKYPDSPKSLREMMRQQEEQMPALIRGVYDAAGQIDRSFNDSDRVMQAFALLEMFGYWPDSKGTYAKSSRFPDGQHVSNGVYFDVLSTGDRGMRNRAVAAYELIGVGPSVMKLDELKLYLREN